MKINDNLNDKIFVCDGGLGTSIQNYDLDLEKDFLGRSQEMETLFNVASEAVKGVATSIFLAGHHKNCLSPVFLSPVSSFIS